MPNLEKKHGLRETFAHIDKEIKFADKALRQMDLELSLASPDDKARYQGQVKRYKSQIDQIKKEVLTRRRSKSRRQRSRTYQKNARSTDELESRRLLGQDYMFETGLNI